jgi:hypothetical protein
MAKIKYIAPSPKAGQISHERPDVARTLIAAGFAEAIPYKDFRERLAQEGQVGTDAHNTDPNLTKQGEVKWSVLDSDSSGFRAVVIVRLSGSEKLYYSGPTSEMPPAVIKRFEELMGEPDQAAVRAQERDAARTKQLLYEHSLKDIRRY